MKNKLFSELADLFKYEKYDDIFHIEDSVSYSEVYSEDDELTPTDIAKEEINKFIREDNLDKIKEILSTEIYPELNKEQKEKHIFMFASYMLKYHGNSEKIVKFFIFDCNIKEEKSIIPNEPVKRLFMLRRVNQELNATLVNDSDNKQNKKRVKI